MTASSLEVIPALHDRLQHQPTNCIALVNELVGLIRDSGNSQFAVILRDTLEQLPEVRAHDEYLFHVDSSVADCSPEGLRASMVRIFHKNPDFIELLNSMPQRSAA